MSGAADGGPAFPSESYDHDAGMDTVKTGMSLRDWFAGQMLPAVVSMSPPSAVGLNLDKYKERTAVLAYRFADAMLAARAKSGSDQS